MPPTACEPLGLRNTTVYRPLWLSQRHADDTCTVLCAHTLKVMLIRFSSSIQLSMRDSHLHTMKSSDQKAVLKVTAGAASRLVHWLTTKEPVRFLRQWLYSLSPRCMSAGCDAGRAIWSRWTSRSPSKPHRPLPVSCCLPLLTHITQSHGGITVH